MPSEITSVAVLGSGYKAIYIAAHLANAGVDVMLLDAPDRDAMDPSHKTKDAREALAHMTPSPLMQAGGINYIMAGNWDDNISHIKNCQWIIDALPDDLDQKKEAYRILDEARAPSTPFTSASSVFTAAQLTEDRNETFCQDFLITRFFMPVRTSKLIEFVPCATTRPDIIDLLEDFCDRKLGKTILHAKDHPGFIFQRLLAFLLQQSLTIAIEEKVRIEDVDSIFTKIFGFPRTGMFGLFDNIGSQVAQEILDRLKNDLPDEDPFVVSYQDLGIWEKLDKGQFYRTRKTEEGVIKESFSLIEKRYKPFEKSHFEPLDQSGETTRDVFEGTGAINRFAWRILSMTTLYACQMLEDVTDDFTAIDIALTKGLDMTRGLFALIDHVGADWIVERLDEEGFIPPKILERAGQGKGFYHSEDDVDYKIGTEEEGYLIVRKQNGFLSLSAIKKKTEPVATNESASLWDLGDGVMNLEFHSKMNALNEDIFAMMHQSIKIIENDRDRWHGLVIHNEAPNFSVGANLAAFSDYIKAENWEAMEAFIKCGQKAHHALRFASFPIVAAPSGLCLGGGCEVLLHCDAIQAHAETFPGLVEVGVGLIPGWGGCTQSLVRAFESRQRLGKVLSPISFVFENIMQAVVSKSALEAKTLLFLRPTDGVSMNKERTLFDAKTRIFDLVQGYKPPEEVSMVLPGEAGQAALNLTLEAWRSEGRLSPYEEKIGQHLADLLCGSVFAAKGSVSELDLMSLERRVFLTLSKNQETLARIDHMLKNGKPLKN